ncbi:MAG TPA: heterodisulfide reductase-related iron-sulfur binding cluster [Anaerolineales bacterium]
MLTLPEKIIFILGAIATLYAIYLISYRIVRTIGRGKGKVDWTLAPKRALAVFVKIITFQPVLRFRFWPSLFHNFVAWGFTYYLLINLGDVLQGFIPNFHFFGQGTFGGVYRLIGDILSVAVLVGMIFLVIRRWLFRPANLTTRQDVLLQPAARAGIKRDSAIVAGFILVHVGSRFLGQTVRVAMQGSDPWQPLASAVSGIWAGANPASLMTLEHVFFWGAIGTIMTFFPYFLISKHIHLFFAPLNFLLKPERPSFGALYKIDFDDESLEQFGATRLEDLHWENIMDAYACIMCYRCQEVCPAYNTGKVLSPAAMEINKRYLLNFEGARIARGEPSSKTLAEFAIPPEAVWACTACGACVDICPVGNEPMRDILEIRRSLVLMENEFPKQLQTAFRGMERTANPWNVPPAERLKWAEGLNVPTIGQNATPDLLWWVGCAPATDARAQKTAQAFAKVLNSAGVNFAVLGEMEQCNGDSARRAGKEDTFFGLATANVEILNEVAPKRIVTTCPHCLHVLKNEYPAYGGNYTVIHHSQLIHELIAAGSLKLKPDGNEKITFHDPCYLGRQNNIVDDPRQVLIQTQSEFIEMPRHGKKSFCCGAGGAQMWKEEEHGSQRVNANRFREAVSTGADTLAVGCPFCMIMLTDAKKDANSEMQVLDIAEIVLAQLEQ